MSKRRAGLAVERREFVARLLAARWRCELLGLIGNSDCTFDDIQQARIFKAIGLCSGRAVDVHEIVGRGRSGGVFVPSQGLTDDDVLCLCRNCHTFVTDQPLIARLVGAERHYQPKET